MKHDCKFNIPPHSTPIHSQNCSRVDKNIFARVVDSVIEGIPNPSRTAPNVLETSLTPVELLDVLGFSGYRVVGVSSKNNKMVNYFSDDTL